MMFALWTAVTFLRPLARAYSKANRAIRSLPVMEIAFKEMAESWRIDSPVSFSASAMMRAAASVPCSNSIPA